MKRIAAIIGLMLFTFSVKAQDKHFNTLINEVNIDSLKKHAMFHFDQDELELTTIDEENTKLLQTYNIIIFLGTWCSDSQELVPTMYNYFQTMKLSAGQIKYYGLEENKTSQEKLEEQFKIEFVPTILFLDKETGEEKGRIVEKFKQNIAQDINSILK